MVVCIVGNDMAIKMLNEQVCLAFPPHIGHNTIDQIGFVWFAWQCIYAD